MEFPKTADGWQQAWARFQAVDPQGAQIYQSAGAVAAQAPHTSGFAIASLVLGIVGGVVLGLVFGYVALNQIKKSGGTLGGRGLAIAGITLGWVWLGIIVIAAANSGGGY